MKLFSEKQLLNVAELVNYCISIIASLHSFEWLWQFYRDVHNYGGCMIVSTRHFLTDGKGGGRTKKLNERINQVHKVGNEVGGMMGILQQTEKAERSIVTLRNGG